MVVTKRTNVANQGLESLTLDITTILRARKMSSVEIVRRLGITKTTTRV